jgi:hypothetical protein
MKAVSLFHLVRNFKVNIRKYCVFLVHERQKYYVDCYLLPTSLTFAFIDPQLRDSHCHFGLNRNIDVFPVVTQH